MKKLFLFWFLAALAGCTADPADPPSTPAPADPRHGVVVSVEEALGELDALMQALTQHTRSGEAFDGRKAIRDIRVSGGSKATRSHGFDLPDTMAYVVNFADDRGFAVLGAHRTLEPVYALTESGSFDADKLDAAIAEAQARRLHPEAAPETRTQEAERACIGTDFAYVLLAEAMVATPRIAADTLEVSYGPWQTYPAIGPLIEVKWTQTYPFNISMPTTTIPIYQGDYYYKKRFPVGCGPIAIAQVMTCIRHPSLAPAATKNYSWTSLKSLSTYDNLNKFRSEYYADSTSATDKVNMQALADVLYHLGVCFNASYNEGGTGVGEENMVAGLKRMDPTYYKNARVTDVASNLNVIYDNLNDTKPMCMTGWAYTPGDGWSGHYWVVDGYFSRSRTVTKKIRYGYTGPIQTITGTEHSRFFHINWGYLGSADGYFAEGVFDMAQRFSKDEVTDKNTSSYKGSDNYYYNNQVILY